MTHLFISADLEGVHGVVSPSQCDPKLDENAHMLAVEQMALEINTVAESAFASGVTRIVVNDSHASMTNLKVHQLDKRIELLTGKPKRCSMMAGLDNTFSGVFLLGYHTKAGTVKGLLGHTFHDRIYDVSLNGVSYGEGGLNALLASMVYQCPVVLTSGDAAYCNEIKTLISKISAIETKKSLSFSAAKCHSWDTLGKTFQTAVKTVLAEKSQWSQNLITIAPPYQLDLTFVGTYEADLVDLIPGLERVDGRTVRFIHDDFMTVYRTIQACYSVLPKH